MFLFIDNRLVTVMMNCNESELHGSTKTIKVVEKYFCNLETAERVLSYDTEKAQTSKERWIHWTP